MPIAPRRVALCLATLAVCAACASDGDVDPVKDPGSVAKYLLTGNDHELRAGEIRVTFLGTSTLLFDDGVDQILVDGFVTRPSLARTAFGRLRSDRDLVDSLVAGLPMDRLRAIFVTHSHYDHAMDVMEFIDAVKRRWNNDSVQLFGSPSTYQIGCGGGLDSARIKIVNGGTKGTIDGTAFEFEVFESLHAVAPWYVLGIGGSIDEPLTQPASQYAYNEGGTLDFLITHGTRSILVKSSANFIENGLANLAPDVLFLGVGRLTEQEKPSAAEIYLESVEKVGPKRVIGTHWDDFFEPLGPNLPPDTKAANDSLRALDFLRGRMGNERFGILQGLQRFVLFAPDSPEVTERVGTTSMAAHRNTHLPAVAKGCPRD